MPSASLSDSNLAINPLGPGDLIDRAVRFYRSNFWTFVLMAAPPIIVGTLVSVGWTILSREVFYTSSKNPGDAAAFSALTTWFGNTMIWFVECVATLVVMGGASRNFVRHILFHEPITVKETYSNVRKRLFGLIGATTMIVLLLTFIGGGILYFGLAITTIAVFLTAAIFSFAGILAFIAATLVGIACGGGTLWLFFLLASRFAYVPQIMLVEGQGVFEAIGRSTSLASGNVKRFGALFIFSFVATYSALFLFYVPLGWIAYINGMEAQSILFDPDTIPAWYVIATQLISQASMILLMPVWMIGLCLLYIDERVRHEGYDIELMAARNLGEIPPLPKNYMNPLQPALSPQAFNPGGQQQQRMGPPRRPPARNSTLGLD